MTDPQANLAGHQPLILLITLSNIGDAVMTTPVLEAMHQKYPDAVFDLVADARSSQLFTHCPYIDEVILKDKQAGWRGTVALVKRLRCKHYDRVIDLRTDGLSLLLRAGRRLTRRRRHAPDVHAVQRHFAAIRDHEGLQDIPAPCVWLSEAEHTFAHRLLAGLSGHRWLALGPGANWQPKCWPVANYCELAARLEEHFDGVILLGSHADQAACQAIKDNQPLPSVNLAGHTTLLQAAAVLAQSRVFIGSDSGLGHLAAASGTPTVTVFGPGDPPRYHPWHPESRWVRSETGRIRDIASSPVVELVLEVIK